MIEAALWTGGALMLAYPLAALHWLGYRSWRTASATVVRLQDDPSPLADQGTLKTPVFCFETETGERVEVADPVFSNTKRRVGDKVAIIYPVASPSHARLAKKNLYTMHLVAGTFGLVVFVLGMLGN